MPDILHLTPAAEGDLSRPARVRTRDGVRLATDVYLPSGDTSPGDTILIRLPYDKNGEYTFIPLVAEYFMQHGYRVVAQDVRGKFRSEGDALLFVNEARDGEDTLDWIVQQPWSNGRVAMWGDSYYGYTQWAAAASGHPALRAIAPRVTGTGLGEPVRAHSGDRTRAVEWAITNLYPLTHFAANDTYLWDLDWSRRDFAAQAEAFIAGLDKRPLSYDQWVPHAVSLPRFPQGDPFAGRSVPVLHTIGWWDNCAPLSWADVAAIEQRPAWALHHHLRIEAIDHESYQLLEAPEDRVEDRTEAQIRALLPRTLDPALAFFEVFVRGNGSPADIPRVEWNLAGTEEMRVDEAWPPRAARAVELAAGVGGTLREDRAADATEVSWVHDPMDPVPSTAPDAFSYLLALPDEAPLGTRDDVLVFESAPVSEQVDFAGPVSARARVRSTGPVMDCFVRLLDVAPDGTAVRIARGQRQLRDATTAGALDIDLGQLGYRLAPGHRLRVHVASTDYPEYLPQPGTGADPWTDGVTTVTNTQFLEIGGPEGLALTLTVLDGALS
ncbi:CocE/NonD family hydrolase [Leucobacter rhizosphaerae]|uniref:CocE/NonD family hydrolase n=1 Tax=Leucobacter rhizosphaerae TaxID=2932245 RepID=A0ABY4FY48_9MICO|nr:CocE/NonD family hydrolase [Leucobacter rhizosphaerae]UOQ61227.1 CocE/NonD family hydrolase [Leucobacter rhizosphaerae]